MTPINFYDDRKKPSKKYWSATMKQPDQYRTQLVHI